MRGEIETCSQCTALLLGTVYGAFDKRFITATSSDDEIEVLWFRCSNYEHFFYAAAL